MHWGAVTVAVKFNRIQQKQPVGFIVADPAGIAGADLINWTTLSVYNAGVLVGQTGTGGVLGLDVIGTNGRQYMETTPSSAPFDEVRITFSGVVNALKTIQLAGVYTRQDSNGDGIPDCAEVTPGQDETIDFLGVTAHLCQGSPIVLQVKGGTNGNNYLLRFYNVVKNNEVTDKTVALTNQTFTITNMPAGIIISPSMMPAARSYITTASIPPSTRCAPPGKPMPALPTGTRGVTGVTGVPGNVRTSLSHPVRPSIPYSCKETPTIATISTSPRTQK